MPAANLSIYLSVFRGLHVQQNSCSIKFRCFHFVLQYGWCPQAHASTKDLVNKNGEWVKVCNAGFGCAEKHAGT